MCFCIVLCYIGVNIVFKTVNIVYILLINLWLIAHYSFLSFCWCLLDAWINRKKFTDSLVLDPAAARLSSLHWLNTHLALDTDSQTDTLLFLSRQNTCNPAKNPKAISLWQKHYCVTQWWVTTVTSWALILNNFNIIF